MEEWKKIDMYEKYEISNYGNIRRGNYMLKRSLHNGYKHVSLQYDATTRLKHNIQDLIYNAFVYGGENVQGY